MADAVSRSLSLDLIPPDASRQAILNSIRRYRAACRQLYAVLLLANTAGAELVEDGENVCLVPGADDAKITIACALGAAKVTKDVKVKGEGQSYLVTVGSSFAYELRPYFLETLYPNALSFVWDAARRDVTTVWKSLDPEHTKAKRGWLALQGARGVAQFQRRGIGFPIKTARPKLDGHALTLKWDKEIGLVEFIVPNMDGGRYVIWKRLRDKEEGWELGTIYLTERDGRVYGTVTYQKPAEAAELDSARICRVSFSEDIENWLCISGPDGSQDVVSAAEAIAWLTYQRKRREELERRKAACGSPKRPWGQRKPWEATQDLLSRVTLGRTRGVAYRNHAWARRIVTRAVTWRCGTIHIGDWPDNLAGHPWPWTELEQCIRYKAQERGLQVAQR